MSICDKCGKRYKPYPLLYCKNPACITHHIAVEMDRTICKDCREKERNGDSPPKKVTRKER